VSSPFSLYFPGDSYAAQCSKKPLICVAPKATWEYLLLSGFHKNATFEIPLAGRDIYFAL